MPFYNKMPKQQEPNTGGVGHLRHVAGGPPKLNKPFFPPNHPSLGSSKPATTLLIVKIISVRSPEVNHLFLIYFLKHSQVLPPYEGRGVVKSPSNSPIKFVR